MSSVKTWIEISRSALESNAKSLFELASGAEVIFVIKANAYGHGLLEVASVLSEAGAEWFAVDNLHEAITLRDAGYSQNLLILGFVPRDGLEDAIKRDISFVVFNEDQISYIEARKGERRAKIHIPVETGLYREGFEIGEFEKIIERTRHIGNIELEGIQTHFADIEDVSLSRYADKQLNEYKKYLDILKEYDIDSIMQHTAASAASLLYSKTHFDLIRPGIALYGLWPSEDTKSRLQKLNSIFVLKPVLSWKTVIAQLKFVRAGESIGYGLTEMLERDSKIAVLPIGYYDGFDRVGMSSKAEVLVRGERCKIVGRICMNMCMADVTDILEVKNGDEVVLLGKQKDEEISVEEMAERMGSINYEVVARLGAHIERRLI